jgi:dipeptidyl aminopeptidase/acylaminoacyl peptidase
MNRTFKQLLIAIFLVVPPVHGQDAKIDSIVGAEKSGVDKIAQLTAKEHSTILFAIADQQIGYAKDGHVEWINSNHDPQRTRCAWPHPALSHDGLRVAFVSDGDKPKHCRIVIQDMPTGTRREVIDTTDDPGEISWSWDDTEIAFADKGISAVSVKDGVKKVLLPFPMEKLGGREFTFWVWCPMQWLHNGKDLVVELKTEIPTKELGTYEDQSNVLFVSGGTARVIDIGSQPAVSPIADQIVYYAPKGIMTINAASTEPKLLAKPPSTLLFFKDELFWKIVWSPDGNRLFFGTIVSENRRDNLYLLDVKSGHFDRFLSHTSITIRGWR